MMGKVLEMGSDEHSKKSNGNWRQVFACDLRSLAVMRMALGCLVLVDLGMRSRSIQAMYTDDGFFPLSMWREYVAKFVDSADPMSWSLHALHGGMTLQVVLFAIAAFAAVMLTLGWKTRIACAISWVLLVSLQMRNPLILHSGDALFRLALFWGMFLPLGSVWSVDARKQPKVDSGQPVITAATLGLIMTLFSLYFFAGIAKLNDFWLSGNAMEYVLKLDIYTTSFGKVVLQSPLALKLLTWSTLAGEIILPILLLTPWKNRWWRNVGIVFFIGLHIGIASCMSIGLFSPVAIAIWLALLPPTFWERFEFARLSEEEAEKRVPLRALPRWANAFCLVMVIYFLCWNLATVDHPAFKKMMPQQARILNRYLNMRHSFRMFDTPPPHSPWFVYEARLKNGAEVDIFRHKPLDHERPTSVLATIPEHHWRRLHRNLARPSFEDYRTTVSEYMVRNWNQTHDADSQIITAKTTAYLDEITRDSESNGTISQVWFQYGGKVADQQLFDDLLKQVKEKGIILP